VLYQATKSRIHTRACSIESNRSGYDGRYLTVLNAASEYGLSSDTLGRDRLRATARSSRSFAILIEVICAPRSECMASWPGAMFSRYR